MPRGQPDYGLYTGTPVASGISDPGEAAARLGSINVFDRRGWVVYLDDFEAPVLKWWATTTGTGTVPVFQSAIVFSGAQCPYFHNPAVNLDRSYLYRTFPLIRLGKIGAEIWVCGSTQMPGNIFLTIQVSDGVNVTRGQWKIDTVDSTIYIVSGGIDIPIATNAYAAASNRNFLPVKLVIDIDSDYYTRLLQGPDEYDLSAYPLDVVGGPGNRMVDVLFGVEGAAAFIMDGYADNFILTQNEP